MYLHTHSTVPKWSPLDEITMIIEYVSIVRSVGIRDSEVVARSISYESEALARLSDSGPPRLLSVELAFQMQM